VNLFLVVDEINVKLSIEYWLSLSVNYVSCRFNS